MNMTREERVLATIARRPVDYLPCHIYFAATETKNRVQEALGFSSDEQFDQYLDSHLQYGFALDDTIFRYRQEPERLRWVESLGFCRIDWEAGVVYDRWGIGLDMHSPGYCVRHHPLRGRGEQGLKTYRVPDVSRPEIMIEAKETLLHHQGETLVICPGYNGIFERAWQVTGFEEFMMGMSLYPNLIERLLDDITDFKVETARQAWLRMAAVSSRRAIQVPACRKLLLIFVIVTITQDVSTQSRWTRLSCRKQRFRGS